MLFVFLLLLPYNSNVLSRALYILCGLLLYVKKLHCWKYILSRFGFFSKKFKLFVLDCRVSDGITNGCGSGAEGRLEGRIIIVRRIPLFFRSDATSEGVVSRSFFNSLAENPAFSSFSRRITSLYPLFIYTYSHIVSEGEGGKVIFNAK